MEYEGQSKTPDLIPTSICGIVLRHMHWDYLGDIVQARYGIGIEESFCKNCILMKKNTTMLGLECDASFFLMSLFCLKSLVPRLLDRCSYQQLVLVYLVLKERFQFTHYVSQKGFQLEWRNEVPICIYAAMNNRVRFHPHPY